MGRQMIKKPGDEVQSPEDNQEPTLPSAKEWLAMGRRERYILIEGIFSTNDRHDAALKLCSIADAVDDAIKGRPLPQGSNSHTVEETMVTTTVTWGAEKFSPVQYNTVDVGPFSMEVTASESEIEAKMAQAYAKLEAFAEKVKLNKLANFKNSVKGNR